MSDARSFFALYAQNCQTLVNTLMTLQTQNQQLTLDPGLITRYFALPTGQSRTDIAAADVANTQSAIVQMLFAYNSGSPSQAQFILKMTP